MVAGQPSLHDVHGSRTDKFLRVRVLHFLHLPGGIVSGQPGVILSILGRVAESSDDRVQYCRLGVYAFPRFYLVLSHREGPTPQVWGLD